MHLCSLFLVFLYKCKYNTIFISAEVHTLQQELEEERAVRTQTETKLRDSESSLKNMQIRSKQLLGKMQERLEEMDKKTVILSLNKTDTNRYTVFCLGYFIVSGWVHATELKL